MDNQVSSVAMSEVERLILRDGYLSLAVEDTQVTQDRIRELTKIQVELQPYRPSQPIGDGWRPAEMVRELAESY